MMPASWIAEPWRRVSSLMEAAVSATVPPARRLSFSKPRRLSRCAYGVALAPQFTNRNAAHRIAGGNGRSAGMNKLDFILEELVTANRILAKEGVVDSFGHVSARHPDDPQRYLLSRARAPERIDRDDIVAYRLDGTAIDERGRAPYLERFIHGAIYEQRPDVHAVVHNHSPSVIPFGVTEKKLKPLLHMCASIGHEVPVWDSHDKFGDTTLLVTDMDMGRDLARTLGERPTALMRGHGATVVGRSVRHAVFVSVYLELGAKLQMQAMAMGEIKFLTPGEVDKITARVSDYSLNRAWENWARRAGRDMQKQP
jgi:ribulose-5-phosphate 4-epimerase/fuculose-1-phosphate aldolase